MAQEMLEEIEKAEAASELRLSQARQTADKRIEEEKKHVAQFRRAAIEAAEQATVQAHQKAQEQAQQKKMEILRSYQSAAFSIQQRGQAKMPKAVEEINGFIREARG